MKEYIIVERKISSKNTINIF